MNLFHHSPRLLLLLAMMFEACRLAAPADEAPNSPRGKESQDRKDSRWVDVMPTQRIFRSSREYRHLTRFYRRDPDHRVRCSDPRAVKTPHAEFEIRRIGDRQIRVDKFPCPTYHPNHRVFGPKGIPIQTRMIGPLPDGEYLAAFTVDGLRCSNVAEFRIDSDYKPPDREVLQSAIIEPAPDQALPCFGLRVFTPASTDTTEIAPVVAFLLRVNGIERRLSTYIGRKGRPKPDEWDAAIIDLDRYHPKIEPKERHEIVAKVGPDKSIPVVVTLDQPLGRMWDEATPDLQIQMPPVLLRGKVIGEDGKPAQRYTVVLCPEPNVRHTEWTDEEGEYEFVHVPDGEYRLSSSARDGGGVLVLTSIKLEAGKTRVIDLDMEEEFAFSGKVIYSDGTPVRGVRLHASWRTSEQAMEYSDGAVTDDKGRYTLGAPFDQAAHYVGISGGVFSGPKPRPKRGVKSGRDDVDFVLSSDP